MLLWMYLERFLVRSLDYYTLLSLMDDGDMSQIQYHKI